VIRNTASTAEKEKEKQTWSARERKNGSAYKAAACSCAHDPWIFRGGEAEKDPEAHPRIKDT